MRGSRGLNTCEPTQICVEADEESARRHGRVGEGTAGPFRGCTRRGMRAGYRRPTAIGQSF